MSRLTRPFLKFLLLLLAVISVPDFLSGQTPPALGTVATYGAFTGVGEVTNTGLTQIVGNIGTDAGAITGFPPGIYTGSMHVADASSLAAKSDLTIAWNQLGTAPCDTALVALGNGQVLTARTYCVGSATTFTGNLTLDAQGNPNAVFIIKVGGALNVAATSRVILTNLAQAANVYWRIDGALSVLDNSVFKGTIVANGAVHLYGGTTLEGRALSIVGAITMASNTIAVSVSAPSSLIVLKPAAGDSITGGTQNYPIIFTGINVTLRKTLEYSLDSGTTWRAIDTIRSTDSAYPWDVPDTTSTKAFVRITDSNGIRGTSRLFTIKRNTTNDGSIDSLILGGVVNNRISNGRPINISWTFTPNIGPSVNVDYSLDSGRTWNRIATVLTSAPQNVTWTTPATGVYDAALIRVTSTFGMQKTSSPFRIAGSIDTLTLGGVVNNQISNGRPINISWTFTPDIGTSVNVDYSLDTGRTWNRIATVLTSAPQNVTWTTPATGTSNAALIRVLSTLGMQKISNPFRISGSIDTLILGGVINNRIGNGRPINISWTFTPDIGTSVNADYSLDTGRTWNRIATVLTSAPQNVTWTTPATGISDAALIRITSTLGMQKTSNPFRIAGSIDSVILGGVINNRIGNGRPVNISWTVTPDIGTSVNVDYSLDTGRTWNRIATVLTSAPQNVTWTTPWSGTSDAALIRVTSTLGMQKTSNPFRISSPPGSIDSLTLGGVVNNRISNGRPINISWAFTPDIGTSVNVDYSLDTGRTWNRIATVLTSAPQNVTWTTPATGASDALIRVISTFGMQKISSPFRIAGSIDSLTLGGVVNNQISNGRPINISWTFTPDIGTSVNVDYSLDTGRTWNRIATVLTSAPQNVTWTTPATGISNAALIRVLSTLGMQKISNPFRITGSIDSLTLGGVINNQIGNRRPITISWAFTPDIGTSVNVEYSLDSGRTWSAIATVPTSAPQRVTWTTPTSGASNAALIRVTSTLGMQKTSNPFRISSPPGSIDSLTLGGVVNNQINNGMTMNISWAFTPDIGTSVNVEYSLDNGRTWRMIATVPTSAAQTVAWMTPSGESSDAALIRVTSSAGMQKTSNRFRIGSTSGAFISLNLGGVNNNRIGNGTPMNISWTFSPDIGTSVNVDYSLDSGRTWSRIATIPTNVNQNVTWTTPASNSYDNALIRVTSSMGMQIVSRAFRIGTDAGAINSLTLGGVSNRRIGNGMPVNISWTFTPDIGTSVNVEYSLDSGKTWRMIATVPTNVNQNVIWITPAGNSYDNAFIRVTSSLGMTKMSEAFRIGTDAGAINSLTLGGVVNNRISNGRQMEISWTFTPDIGTSVNVEYSLDSGKTWSMIATIPTNVNQNVTWTTPANGSYDNAFIRVTSSAGMQRMSRAFRIGSDAGAINSLTLGGVMNRQIGNMMPMDISWTFTPDIGTSVNVEYSLDSGKTWTMIATIPTNVNQNVTWTTPANGSYRAAFIRVTSSAGMQRMSEAFRIGSIAAVDDRGSVAGYSITNFPNPASEATTIEFLLPVRSAVRIAIADELGREVGIVAWRSFEEGSHSIRFNASQLPSGIYTCTLEAGKIKVAHMMTIVK